MVQVHPAQTAAQDGTILYIYGPLANGDYTKALALGNFQDKTIHFYGTFGSGGSITAYGSNDPNDDEVIPSSGHWVALTDPLNNAITKTGTALVTILENSHLVSCKVTAGDNTTALYVAIKAKRT